MCADPVTNERPQRGPRPLLRGERDRDRMAHDHDHRGGREQRLQKPRLHEVLGRLLQQQRPRGFPVTRPLGAHALRVLTAHERGLLGAMRGGVEGEAAGRHRPVAPSAAGEATPPAEALRQPAPVCPRVDPRRVAHGRVHRLEVLALVLDRAGALEAADGRDGSRSRERSSSCRCDAARRRRSAAAPPPGPRPPTPAQRSKYCSSRPVRR